MTSHRMCNPAAITTIPSLLKKNGYATGAAVSAYVLRASTGMGGAFDHYDDALDKSEGAAVGELQRAGSRTVSAAEAWIEIHRAEPFFFLLADPKDHIQDLESTAAETFQSLGQPASAARWRARAR